MRLTSLRWPFLISATSSVRDDHLVDVVLHVEGGDAALEVRLHPVLHAGVGVDTNQSPILAAQGGAELLERVAGLVDGGSVRPLVVDWRRRPQPGPRPRRPGPRPRRPAPRPRRPEPRRSTSGASALVGRARSSSTVGSSSAASASAASPRRPRRRRASSDTSTGASSVASTGASSCSSSYGCDTVVSHLHSSLLGARGACLRLLLGSLGRPSRASTEHLEDQLSEAQVEQRRRTTSRPARRPGPR